LLSFFRTRLYLIAIAGLVAIAGCAADQVSPTVSEKTGLHKVPGKFLTQPHNEFKFSDGALIAYGNPETDAAGSVSVNYNDGATLSIFTTPELKNSAARENLKAVQSSCQAQTVSACPYLKYGNDYFGVAPLDGRDWMDSEIWMLVNFNAQTDAIKYQACRDGRYYSAADSKTLMDVVDKIETDPKGARSDPVVEKHLVTDDALPRRLPVCNWRHRIGIEAAYPPPPNEGKVRIVPASHSHGEYVEAKADKGVLVNVFLDEDHRRIDKIIFKSPTTSFSFRPIYNESDCPTLERCEHVVTGPGKQPERFDLRSLDDEPLSQSRIFAVNDTLTDIKYYDGCAGGRLYSGKNRDEVEREVKDALENPAPPPVKGTPILGTPETSESGDVVIPDALCDWTYRRQQAQALMKKSQPAR
jgi:hypothetical protein